MAMATRLTPSQDNCAAAGSPLPAVALEISNQASLSPGSASQAQLDARDRRHAGPRHAPHGEIVVADYLPGRGMVISARKENPVRVWGWRTHEANIAEENEDKLDR